MARLTRLTTTSAGNQPYRGSRQVADLTADALDARLGRAGADIGRLPPVWAIIPSNAVTKELKRFLRAPQASGFLFVYRKLQVAHQPFDRRQHLCRRGLAEYTEVIGIIHDLRAETPGITQRFPAQYEAPHVEIAEQEVMVTL